MEECWQFATGGGEDEDNPPLASAQREAFEEAGIGVLHNDVALFVESKFTLWGIVGARLDLGVWVGIGEIERAGFLKFVILLLVAHRPKLSFHSFRFSMDLQ